MADILIHTVQASSSVVKDVLADAVKLDQFMKNIALDSFGDTKGE